MPISKADERQVVAVHPQRVNAHGLQEIEIPPAPAVPHGARDVGHEVVVREQHPRVLQGRRAIGHALHDPQRRGAVGRQRILLVPGTVRGSAPCLHAF